MPPKRLGAISNIFYDNRARFLCIVIALSLIKCIIFFLVIEILLTPHRQIGYFPDSAMYERIAENIVSGNGYSLSVSAPFKPTMQKEPLYPLLIVLSKCLPWLGIRWVIFIQMLLNPLIAVLIYFIGVEIFDEQIARLASFIVALLPAYGEMGFFIMPENIFIILFASAILCLLKAINSIRWRWFMLSGALLGLSSLCRNAVFLLCIVYFITILIKKRSIIGKGLVSGLVVFAVSFCAVVTPWMLRNQQKLGLFSISSRGGELLAHQAFWAANFSPDEWRAYAMYLLSGNIAQRLYPHIIGNNFGEYEYGVLMRTPYIVAMSRKYSEGEIEKSLLMEGISDIIHNPGKFLLLNAIVYAQSFKYFESIALMLIKGPAGAESALSLIRLFLFIAGFLYTLLALQGMWYARRLFDSFIVLLAIIYFHIALTPVGIIPGGLQRHILPITVFYSFYVVIAINRIRCACS